MLKPLYATFLKFKDILLGKGRRKVFVLTYQRSGTKSIAQFFKQHRFKVSGHGTAHQKGWSVKWLQGNYQAIFNDLDFRSSAVFQDAPWFYPGFYKVLYWKFSKAKFILIERDADAWYTSMMGHSNQRSLGNTHVHATIYNRMEAWLSEHPQGLFENAEWNGLPLTETHRHFYTNIYRERMLEIRSFFKHYDPNNSRFFYGKLENPDVWKQLGTFMGIDMPAGTVYHFHKTADLKKNTETAA